MSEQLVVDIPKMRLANQGDEGVLMDMIGLLHKESGLRDEQDDIEQSRRVEPLGNGACQVLAKTKTITTYPTSAGVFFACQTVKVLGTETEGDPGSITAVGDTFYAYLPTGRTVPASGTLVLCTRIPYRWMIEY